MRKLRHWVVRALLALLTLAVFWQGWYFGWVVWWKYANPGQTSFQAHRLEEMRQKNPHAELKQIWLPYPRISESLKRAVVASEDDKFVDHEGFDWEGMEKALEKNQRKGKVVAGGSTISQQLAKNLFLSASKTPLRKLQEAVITLMLETVWGKQRILEVYLNVVEWGDGIFGAEAAARHYFGVGAGQLDAAQAARLAVLLPAPRRYERNPYSAFINGRTDSILGRMQYSEVP
jgi:monofunctional biosynthetic peptidoglycan transglycosylase